MKITFYQVPVGFNPNFTYLGDLVERHSEDVNIDLKLLEYIDVPLSSSNAKYNYIKVTDNERVYYYSLYGNEYMNIGQLRFKYKIDIVRTLHEMDKLDSELLVSNYSNLLDMDNNKKNYFFRNQKIRLGANILNSKHQVNMNYSDDQNLEDIWENMKWIYVWLQPKRATKVGESNVYSQYSLTTKDPSSVPGTIYSTLPPTGQSTYYGTRPQDGWIPAWGAAAIPGRLWTYKVPGTEEYRYFKATEYQVAMNKIRHWAEYTPPTGTGTMTYYLSGLPPVTNPNLPNNLYCLVFPTNDIYLNDDIIWSASVLFENAFDINLENTWVPNIVDVKISDIPPSNTLKDLIIPGDSNHPYKLNDRLLALEPNLTDGTYAYSQAGEYISRGRYKYHIPAIRSKLTQPIKVEVKGFEIPEVMGDFILHEKYYLSMFEERIELDIALLINDKATTLYFYEDIQPGRTNYILGYAPLGPDIDVMHYLSHSPSTLSVSRDSSLPVFTSNYESYISNNKNFIAQAELTRNTQLLTGLINSGSQALGSAAVGMAVPNYNPSMAIAGAAGNAINALINKNTQEKLMNWSIDNMKTAPGSYKNANATTSLILTLGVSKPWIGKYISNSFDVSLYRRLLDEVGYQYFDFPYNLKLVIKNATQSPSGTRKFLQGTLNGITYGNNIDMYLLNLLYRYLSEGINIYL